MPIQSQLRLIPILASLCLPLAPGCSPDQGGGPVAGGANERRGGGPDVPPGETGRKGPGGQSSAPGEPNAARP